MKYNTVLRANPQNRNAARKNYAIPVYTGEIDLKHIAAEIAALSSLSSGDVYNVLINFTEALPKYLKDGYKLRLGDFGIFKVSFSSEGVDDAKQIVPARIRSRRVLYTPGKDIKTSLEGMHFELESPQ
ncbi:MAG: HU family DNA-binding protein [Dysgonamonadaceae bacterium]|jgi:predicted histone-like DNA-binding protein|nr:HU family DNA-binding protein [Dysgonamonadaceae bacterium]